LERLGLSAKEMYELSTEIWANNEDEIARTLSEVLKESKTPEDVLRKLTTEMSVKYIPLVLTHVIEANNVKITSQVQELLKK